MVLGRSNAARQIARQQPSPTRCRQEQSLQPPQSGAAKARTVPVLLLEILNRGGLSEFYYFRCREGPSLPRRTLQITGLWFIVSFSTCDCDCTPKIVTSCVTVLYSGSILLCRLLRLVCRRPPETLRKPSYASKSNHNATFSNHPHTFSTRCQFHLEVHLSPCYSRSRWPLFHPLPLPHRPPSTPTSSSSAAASAASSQRTSFNLTATSLSLYTVPIIITGFIC